VRDDHDLVSEGDGMQEDLSYPNNRVSTRRGRLYGEVDAAQDGQSSQRSEAVTGVVLNSAMKIDSTYLHDHLDHVARLKSTPTVTLFRCHCGIHAEKEV